MTCCKEIAIKEVEYCQSSLVTSPSSFIMKLQIVGIFLFFTCVGATFLSSGHLDFMAGAKKENILHLKDPHAEVQGFSEAFKDVANSEEKVKTTFRILNRPNDSRFKLDLMLIISQVDILDNESQSFENKEKAWAVLQPLLEKYDKDFTYPADYDVLSGDFIEIILDDWLDRYTQEKIVRNQSSRKDAEELPEGSGRLESDDRELKSVLEGSGSFEEYLTSLEPEGEESTTREGAIDEAAAAVTEEDLAAFLSDEGEVVEDSSTEEDDSASTEETVLHFSTEQGDSSEGYELHTTASTEDESEVSEGYEVRYTTDEEESSAEVFIDEISRSEGETSREYQLVGTTEDGQAVLQSTTEYYLPEVDEHEVLDLLAEDGEVSNEVSEEDDGSLEFRHRAGYIVVGKEPVQAGSIRGIPGVHFPDYDEIPITSFSCAEKKYIPGFYADLETGCQVFHVCWPHRRESFLCPIGTLFNQAILSCDYWYSTNCSLSPLHYDVNNCLHETTQAPRPPTDKSTTPKSEPPATPTPSLADVDWTRVLSILPIRSKVTVYPQSSSKTSPAEDDISGKTEQDKALKKAIATKIIGKVLHAAQILAKTAVRTLPISYATKKPIEKPHPIKVHTTEKPHVIKIRTTEKPHPIKVHTTEKPQIKVHTTEKPVGKVHGKQPPKIMERFVVKPKKFDALKPILGGKLATHPKVGKQHVVKKVKLVKEHVPSVLLGAMEMAGTVLQKDILPLTRMALVESSLKHSKSKKH